ncbi:polysaccharide deacetylase family protein [Streptomyces anulatus]|uniref:polysaccharide deacetylase family protein n=1 Tax=Streptomyces anulatus TaxID=1892 RepID=UPI0038706A88
MPVMTHRSYGPLVGVPRLLKIFARHQIRAMFCVPGRTALRHPHVVRAIAETGNEIAHHGFLHGRWRVIDADTDAAYPDRGLEALETVATRRAGLWRIHRGNPDPVGSGRRGTVLLPAGHFWQQTDREPTQDPRPVVAGIRGAAAAALRPSWPAGPPSPVSARSQDIQWTYRP